MNGTLRMLMVPTVLVFGCTAPSNGSTADGTTSAANGATNGTPAAGQSLGTAQQGAAGCPATPAPALFDHALCVCDRMSLVAVGLHTSRTGAGPASVGVNGDTEIAGEWDVDGDLALWKGVAGFGNAHVVDDFSTNGSFEGAGVIQVDHDLSIGGDLLDAGSLTVNGTLRVAGNDTNLGVRKIAATGVYTAGSEPCGCSGPALLDVAAAVAQAKTMNDNAKIGLASKIAALGTNEIDLPSGIYYLDRFISAGSHKIVISGAVSLYVDSDITEIGKSQIQLGAGATLDLYVNGTMATVGDFALGDSAQPGALRLYIGGSSPISVNFGNQSLNALIYAPLAEVAWAGTTTLRGALLAGSLTAAGEIDIAYDSGATTLSASCDPGSTAATPGDDQPVFVQ